MIVSVSVAMAASDASVAVLHVSLLPGPKERGKKTSLTKIFTFSDNCAVRSMERHHSLLIGRRQSIGCRNADKETALRTRYSVRTVRKFSSDTLDDCLVLVSTL